MVGVRRAPVESITRGERRRNLRFGGVVVVVVVGLMEGGVTTHPSTPVQIFSEEVDSGDQLFTPAPATTTTVTALAMLVHPPPTILR